jgi:pSer/pThr/pTyr-binding forkhead associated (FHA) protein
MMRSPLLMSVQPTLRLRAQSGPGMVDYVVPVEGGVVVGRSRECGLVLRPDDTVSRKHCSIVPVLGRWVVDDLQSKHGTTVNGVQIVPGQGVTLEDGDLLGIGDWTLLVELERL